MQAKAVQAALVALATELGGALLALDTSGDAAALALVTPGAKGALYASTLQARALPSDAVVQAIVDALAAAKTEPSQLVALAVGLGPGSFTGLRVGLATLKGLAYGTGAKLYGSSSLAMLAAQASPGRVALVRDARQGHVYLGGYDVAAGGDVEAFMADARLPCEKAAAALESAAAQAPKRGQAVQWLGEAAALLGRDPVAALPRPCAACLLWHSQGRMRAGQADALGELAPAYLHTFLPPPTS